MEVGQRRERGVREMKWGEGDEGLTFAKLSYMGKLKEGARPPSLSLR